MRLLIIGGSGFIGFNLYKHFKQRNFVVFGTYRAHPPKMPGEWYALDIRHLDSIKKLIDDTEPTVIINAAGIKNTTFCEFNRPIAHATNTIGPYNIAKAASTADIHLIHITDEQVFDGINGDYTEGALALPNSYCGETKLAGEHAVLTTSDNAVVCRASAAYGIYSPVIRYINENLMLGKKMAALASVYLTPTLASNLAEMIEGVITKRFVGTIHLSGPQKMSRYDFYRAYANEFGLDESLIAPLGSTDPLEKSGDWSLNSAQADRVLAIHRRPVSEGMAKLKVECEEVKTLWER